jgi:hypothetical protein
MSGIPRVRPQRLRLAGASRDTGAALSDHAVARGAAAARRHDGRDAR